MKNINVLSIWKQKNEKIPVQKNVEISSIIEIHFFLSKKSYRICEKGVFQNHGRNIREKREFPSKIKILVRTFINETQWNTLKYIVVSVKVQCQIHCQIYFASTLKQENIKAHTHRSQATHKGLVTLA